ncbi:sensor histidine kinase [Oceanospirillum sp.]|uniref:sensor histidine kinase n=1 Tax=Oceanospirillum sp. TaxID=2021254 RepID=UPI003A913E50
MEEPKKISFTNQLVRSIVLPALLVVALLSALQLYLYYQLSATSMQAHADKQIKLVVPILSKALYDADEETINLIGDSLFQEANVDYLMISDQFSRVYLRSRNSENMQLPSIAVSRSLSYTNNSGQSLLLGNINIQYNPQILLEGRTEALATIVALGILKFVFPLLALTLFLHQKVQRRLSYLIRKISDSRPDNLRQIAPRRSDPGEIKALIGAYNQLQENNFRYHNRQQEAHAKLIERTNEVAESRESARMLTNMLQNSQKRYRALFHRNVDALLIVESFRLEEEERFRIIDANLAAMSILDRALDQLIKQDFEAMFGSKPLEHGRYLLNNNTLPPSLQKANLQIELHFNVVMFEKQGIYYVTLRDVSDKIRAEKLEKEANELMNFRQNQMAIAEMATTIAHEVNQPLAAIQNYALSAINFSKSGQINQDKLHQSLEQLMQQANIASQIVQQARAQLGRNDYPQQPLNLIQALEESQALCQHRADKHNITLSFHSELEKAIAVANEVQFKQIMINTLSNAIEALAESTADPREIKISLYREDHNYVIKIRDNGPGIENIERVFTAHFSTKEKGLGMGLAICRSIAEMHHGSITARNLTPCGAEFTLRLPDHIDITDKKAATLKTEPS